MSMIAVGKPFPDDLSGFQGREAAVWDVDSNTVIVVVPGITSVAGAGLLKDARVWFGAYENLLLMYLELATGLQFEMPASRTTAIPDWANQDDGSHLLLTFVVVDPNTTVVAAMKAATISSHATSYLCQEATSRFTRPLTSTEFTAMFERYQAEISDVPSALRDVAVVGSRLGV